MRLSWKMLKLVKGFGSACPGLRCSREAIVSSSSTKRTRRTTHGRLVGDHLVHVLVDVEKESVAFGELVSVLALGAAELAMVGVELILDDVKAIASGRELGLSIA